MVLAGGALIVGSCFWLGWQGSRWYQDRAALLAALCGDLARMESELRERDTETQTLLRLLAGREGKTACFYRDCLNRWEEGELGLGQAWQDAVFQGALPLSREEAAQLCRVGECLGQYTGPEQAFQISGLRRGLEQSLRQAREEGRERGKLSLVLGITAGLALTVLLV